MSADNYLLIRRAGDRFAVSDESASAPDPGDGVAGILGAWSPIDSPGVTFHDTLTEAWAAAERSYSEYGIVDSSDVDAAGDTSTARLAAAAAAIADRFPLEASSWTSDGGLVLHFGPVTVTVNAEHDQDRSDMGAWIEATAPAVLAGRDD